MKLLQSEYTLSKKIDIKETINSGQVFLWQQIDDSWYGIDGQNIIKAKQNPFVLQSLTKNENIFFRTGDNIDEIFKEISNDENVKSAIMNYPGLRLLRQDPFQCYISFIVSSNSNILNIKNSLQKICESFGDKIEFDKKIFFLFPKPEKLAYASISELKKCGLGYRAKFVKQASKSVFNEKINFDILKKSDYYSAKESLLQVFGIGNKVADCIMLFSLEKPEAFPLDRWMIRILKKYYSDNFCFEGKSITTRKYNELHEKILNYFGKYAGYSQQFLFKMERDVNNKKWL